VRLLKQKNSGGSYLKAGRACNDCLGVLELIGLAASLPVGLNRFGHTQIFTVA